MTRRLLIAPAAALLICTIFWGLSGWSQDHTDPVHGPVIGHVDGPSDDGVVLGSRELTAGVPGKGPLTMAELDAWLADPRNHQPLELQLPLGLNVLPNRLQKLKSPMTRAKIELGRQLFFDPRLSLDGSVSCASCHDPDHGYTVPTRFAKGIRGQEGTRNPPTLVNRVMFGGIGEEEFWDGHAASIEDAVLIAVTDPTEMGNSLAGLIRTLHRVKGYRAQFESIYGKVTLAAVGDAVAAFVRTLVTGPSAYDYYRTLEPYRDDDLEVLRKEAPEYYHRYQQLKQLAENSPMSDSAVRGMAVYFGSKVTCNFCHATPALTDNTFHNLGVGWGDEKKDMGRYLVTGQERDKGAFKTPPVRNAAQTAPYMHDGSLATLEDVVAWYAKGGRQNPYLDSTFVKFGPLTEQEQKDLVEFIKSCTGALPAVERGRLPE